MKERLTGAVILVALIVLLVPELLSGPGVTAQPARATDQDGAPMRSYTIDLADNAGAPRPGPTQSGGTADLQPMAAQEDPAQGDAGEAAQVQPDATPVASTEEERPEAVVPQPQPAPQPQREIVTAVAAATQAPVTGWMIQVGSFASRENAERLSRDLKAKGFVASVSDSRGGGRNLYRVRVGPEADRAAAQAVVSRLRSRGVTGAAIVPHP